MELRAGTVIADKVRLVRPLGRGGMGSVWLAQHLALDSEVAVKFISSKLAGDDPNVLARFRREASAAARIKSPHVVKTFDRAETPDGTPFIVMELLTGESLATRLRRLGPLAFEEASRIVEHIARGLTEAHSLGIVHRDIKPDNVFVTPSDGELFARVLDFGVAKHSGGGGHESVTSTDAMVGTPAYMSPEQVLSAKLVDHRADLWALGVVAYQMLTGRLPFNGETVGAVAVAISRARFRLVSELRPGAGADVDAFFKRALAKRIDARFQSARELAQAFAGALAVPGARVSAGSWPSAEPRATPVSSGEDAQPAHAATAMPISTSPASGAASGEASVATDDSWTEDTDASDDSGAEPAAREAPISSAPTEAAPYGPLFEAKQSAPPDAPESAHTSAPERDERAVRAPEVRASAEPATFGGASAPLMRSASRSRRWMTQIAAIALLASGGVGAWFALRPTASAPSAAHASAAATESGPGASGEDSTRAPTEALTAPSPAPSIAASRATDAAGSSESVKPSASTSAAGPASSGSGTATVLGVTTPAAPPLASASITLPAASVPLVRSAVVPSATKPATPDCSHPFVVDAHGDLVPRRECL